MPRRRPLLTKSKRTSSKPRPTAASRIGEKWNKLQRFDEYPVDHDGDESRHEWITKLKTGDMALVRGVNLKRYGEKDYDDWEFWVLHIHDFALSDTKPGEIWIRGEWFYSAAHVKQLDKSFDTSPFARYELFQSNHMDWVKPDHLHGPTVVYMYTEDAVDQGPINPGEFFTRQRYDHIKKELYPQEGNTGCRAKGCHGAYNPDDTDVAYHFCPRSSCRSWFHDYCLGFQQSWVRERSLEDHALELMCSNPDNDETFKLPTAVTSTSTSLRNIRKSKQRQLALLESQADNIKTLDSLPAQLVALAKSQIIRGPSVHGVSGNVGEVVDARRLVYECLTMNDDRTRDYLEDWKRGHGVKDEPGASNEGASKKAKKSMLGHKGVARPYICPKCGGAI